MVEVISEIVVALQQGRAYGEAVALLRLVLSQEKVRYSFLVYFGHDLVDLLVLLMKRMACTYIHEVLMPQVQLMK